MLLQCLIKYNYIIFTLLNCFLIRTVFSESNSFSCITRDFNDYKYTCPKSFELNNLNILIIFDDGIYVYDPLLSNRKYEYKFSLFDSNLIIDTTTVYKDVYVLSCSLIGISQYDEGDQLVIVLIKNSIILLLSDKGEYKCKQDLSSEINSKNSDSIIAYKYSDNFYYFVVSYVDGSNNLAFFYYKMKNDCNELNKIYSTNTYQLRNNNGDLYDIVNMQLAISKMKIKTEIFVTCFMTLKQSENKLLTALTLNPENNFTQLFNSTYNDNNLDNAKFYSSSSEKNENSKAIVCLSHTDPVRTSCFSFNIKNNTLEKINMTNTPLCYGNAPSQINTYFFKSTQEFVFACISDTVGQIYVKRFSIDDFSLISDSDINDSTQVNDIHSINSFSIIPLKTGNKINYSLLAFVLSNNVDVIRNYYLSTTNCINITINDNVTKNEELKKEEEKEEEIEEEEKNEFIEEIQEELKEEEEEKKEKKENEEIEEIEENEELFELIEKEEKEENKIIQEEEVIEEKEENIEVEEKEENEEKIEEEKKIIGKKEEKEENIEEEEKIENIEEEEKVENTEKEENEEKLKEEENEEKFKEEEKEEKVEKKEKVENIEEEEKVEKKEKEEEENKFKKEEIEEENIKEEIEEQFIKEETKVIDCDLEKCSLCDYNSKQKNLCIKCNYAQNYYPIKQYEDSIEKDCFNSLTIPKNYYLNTDKKYYEVCYISCNTCLNFGNKTNHNCETCAKGYTFLKDEDIKYSKNCYNICPYNYYFSKYGDYTCTEDSICPENYPFYVKNIKKCTNNCLLEKDYIYQYSGECYKNCPSETKNDTFICIDIDKNNCKLYSQEINTNINLQDVIETKTIYYSQEFNYTENHVSLYNNNNYTMAIYKNLDCINELELEIPQIDFGECYNNIQKDNNLINEKLIILSIDFYNNTNNNSYYGFYNPNTGEKLNTTNSCKNETIIIKENILSSLNENEKNAVLYLAKQNINAFDPNGFFYTDICSKFISPNKKDLTLKDRISTYFKNNITLCDDGCNYKGVNITSMLAICECKFRDLFNIIDVDYINNNILYSQAMEQLAEILSSVNINVLKCYKTVFKVEYFKNCVGGFIIMTLIICQIICSIIFYTNDIKNIFKFIGDKKDLYEKYIKSKKDSKKVRNRRRNRNRTKTKKGNPPPKNRTKKKTKLKILQNDNPESSLKKSMSELLPKNNNNNYNRKSSGDSMNILTNIKHKKTKKKLVNSIINSNNIIINKFKNINNCKFNKDNIKKITQQQYCDMEKYLEEPLDELEYEDVLIKENRSMSVYLCEKIKEKQIIINSFFVKDDIISKSQKIILFIVYIDIFFVVNALFYNEKYISELYNSNKRETYFSFVKRSVNRFIYSIFMSSFVKYLIECFFVEEKKIREILLLSQQTKINIGIEMLNLMKRIKINTRNFIITSYCITAVSWFYISCFNNVYPYSKSEWIKSSYWFIMIMQLIYIVFAFLQTIFRYLGIKYKSESLFNFSQLFD